MTLKSLGSAYLAGVLTQRPRPMLIVKPNTKPNPIWFRFAHFWHPNGQPNTIPNARAFGKTPSYPGDDTKCITHLVSRTKKNQIQFTQTN